MNQINTCYCEMLPCGLPMVKSLDVSTRHISERDNELMGNDCDASYPAAIAYRKERGYFVHVSHYDAEICDQRLLAVGYSPEFIQIIQIARTEGASWICFDADGSGTDFLPTFDW